MAEGTFENAQDTNEMPRSNELDLPATMFRWGGVAYEATIMMPTKFGPQNEDVKFTDIDGMAIFEGDINIGETEKIRYDPDSKGIGITGDEFRWEGGIIPYKIADIAEPYKSILISRVTGAIAHWQQLTPLRFVERTNEEDYLFFDKRKGCWSRVGCQGGKQVISIGTGCGLGAAIHEIGHAIGLFHEQSRSDRDEHVEIVWGNIDPDLQHNFDMHIQDADDLGVYDFNSIMHYPASAFSINNQPTIIVKGTQQPIGQRSGLSPGDIASVKLMYPSLNWS